MKKKDVVPEFDEIIFENRNKSYGAYNLRKKYKSTASISILGGISLITMIFVAMSLSGEDSVAVTPPTVVSIIMSNPVTEKVAQTPENKIPENKLNSFKNLAPKVTEDTTEITDYVPTAQETLNGSKNGVPDDTIAVIENTDPVIPKETEIRVFVEEMPEYPGGIPALLKFIGDNLHYPDEAINNKIEGKVFLRFVVNSDGSTDRIEVTRGIDPLLDNEAIRVIKILPKFKPGRQSGVPVPVWYSIPVNFKLENN
jgi:periplasmic protein TonB